METAASMPQGMVMSDFFKGVVIGVLSVLLVFGVVFTLKYLHKRDKEMIEYAERQIEIDEMRESVINSDPVEFIDTIPDVRRAAEGAGAEFERKRDEILQRFRSRNADR